MDKGVDDKLAQLESIIKIIENPQTPLEQSLAEFQRGMALVKNCANDLEQAKQLVEKLTSANNGDVKFEPFST